MNDFTMEYVELTRRKAVLDFALAILHGSDEHKSWLLEAANCFLDDKPLPEVAS